MKWSLVPVALACLAAASLPALSYTVYVDGAGGGDYLTIQEGVDAADNGDTVVVAPGLYDDIHVFEILGSEYQANVFFDRGITLVSAAGPAVTIVDGGGVAEFGILGMPDPDWPSPGDPPQPVIEGFTVRNGQSWYPAKGIVAEEGEARNNVVEGYCFGIANAVSYDYAGIPDGGRTRTSVPLIEGNTCSGNSRGIGVVPNQDGFSTAVVSGNTVSGNSSGVSVRGPSGHARLVGNEIRQNTYGVSVSPGGSHETGTVDVEILRNVIADNTTRNISLHNEWSFDGYWVHATIGGSLEDANDIFGAPENLRLTNWNSELIVDASYNYWGSIYCDEFEPLFVVTVGGEDTTSFTYFPFTDEPHATVYEDCESVATEAVSWGAMKALYR